MLEPGMYGRAAIGTTMLLFPAAARFWVGSDATSTPVKVITRGFGARELGLAVGSLLALRGGGGRAAPWLQACALGDAADALVTVLAWGRLHPAGRGGVAVLASGSAIMMAEASRSVDSA